MADYFTNPWLRGLVSSGIIATSVLIVAAWATWYERKFAGRMQNRIGPNVVGPAGLLQPLADAVKMMRKEMIVPRKADAALFRLAPALAFFFTLATAVVIPWAPGVVVSDLDIGLLWVLAMAGMVLFPLWLAGWASNNKYALFGGMRAVAQGVSYEVPLLLAAMVPVVLSGSFNLRVITEYQRDHGWFAIWPPGIGLLAFLIFFAASLAEANRIPFDIPEAESELIAGVSVEYTGMAYAMFPTVEYMHTWLSSAVAAVLFLGGWSGPGSSFWLIGLGWMLLKTSILFTFIYTMRWTLVRFRSDQLMHLCWTWLVPITLGLVCAAAVWVSLTTGAR